MIDPVFKAGGDGFCLCVRLSPSLARRFPTSAGGSIQARIERLTKSAPSPAQVRRLLPEVGPPDEWSAGGVASFLAEPWRAALVEAWELATPDEKRQVREEYAARFADVIGKAKGSILAPHVTIFFFKPAGEKQGDRAAKILREVAAQVEPFGLALTGGIFYFDPSESSDGKRVACAAVQSDGAVRLRERFVAALDRAGIRPEVNFGLALHATLAYLDPEESFASEVPKGEMTVETVEIWRGSSSEEVPLEAPGFGFTL